MELDNDLLTLWLAAGQGLGTEAARRLIEEVQQSREDLAEDEDHEIISVKNHEQEMDDMEAEHERQLSRLEARLEEARSARMAEEYQRGCRDGENAAMALLA